MSGLGHMRKEISVENQPKKVSFWEQFEPIKKPNYLQPELIFHLEIKQRKIK